MEIGISTSCYYPLETEKSLTLVGQSGVKTCEIFVNAPSEMKGDGLARLKSIRDEYGLQVRTVHPFSSAFESYLLFGNYPRRNRDGVELYKNYFEFAAQMGAEAVVLHGALSKFGISPEEYAENYSALIEAGLSFGIYTAHENVKEHLCASASYLKKVADFVGENFRMVLDVKQTRRSHENEYEFIDLFPDKIIQVHVSDVPRGKNFSTARGDCVPPGQGEYDFAKLFCALGNAGYDKSCLVELYSHNYGEYSEVAEAAEYLKNLIK